METHSVDEKVNDINEHEISHFLKYTLQYEAVQEALLKQRIISRVAADRQIEITDDEIQEEAERQRRELRLERASDTMAWLQSQSIDGDDWEVGIRAQLLHEKLKKELFERDIHKFFNQNRLEFDTVVLYQIVVPYAPLAQELFYQIEEEELSFYEVAHAYDVDEMRRYRCGYEGFIRRVNLPTALSLAIFSAPQGKLTGPIQTEQGYHLLLAEKFIKAELTDDVRDELFDRLFQEWLQSELTYWRCQ
jgi:parvulin-like peptidyl-prolyl isomerase